MSRHTRKSGLTLIILYSVLPISDSIQWMASNHVYLCIHPSCIVCCCHGYSPICQRHLPDGVVPTENSVASNCSGLWIDVVLHNCCGILPYVSLRNNSGYMCIPQVSWCYYRHYHQEFNLVSTRCCSYGPTHCCSSSSCRIGGYTNEKETE